jgi:hypothetical protein
MIKRPLKVKTRVPLWQSDVSFRRLRTFRRMRLYARSAIGDIRTEDRLLDHLVGAGEQRRRDSDTESFLVRYWIKFVHAAKYKTKPHAIAINTNQIAIFPNLGTCP